MTAIESGHLRVLPDDFPRRQSDTEGLAADLVSHRAFPRAWYFLCRSADVKPGGILACEFLGQAIVVFRTAAGELHALAAHCAHMGAHLAGGSVVGDCIRCPLHHFAFDGTGACHTRGQGRQRAWPVRERFGCAFIHHGDEPQFDLPAFDAAGIDEVHLARAAPIPTACSWVGIASNGFDMLHLSTVHERALREPPTVERLAPHRLRLTYVSRVLGRGLADRVMKWLSKDRVHVAINCWGGPLFTVETRVGRRSSMLLLGITPRRTATGWESDVHCVVAARRTGVAPWDGFRARVGLWLFLQFLRKDMVSLHKMVFRVPETFLPAEAAMREFFEFLEELPRGAVERG